MTEDGTLFETRPDPEVRFQTIGGEIPALIVDDFYLRPDEIRSRALGLTYAAPPYPYPGKLAVPPGPDASLSATVRTVLDLVNRDFLPRVPIAQDGRRIPAFRRVHTDFAVVDVHPDELSADQRIPHVDPVPVFGLVYLNRRERGGTLFFRQTADVDAAAVSNGYPIEGNSIFELCGRIEAAFNRLVVYPGFVPHSGDIAGDWIRTDERFSDPRLTQRFVFFP